MASKVMINISSGTDVKAPLGMILAISTHVPLVTHIYVGELGQHWFRQQMVACSAPSHYLNQCCADLLSIEPLVINFSEILIKMWTFSFKKMCLKMLSAKWQASCSGGDELRVSRSPFTQNLNYLPSYHVEGWQNSNTNEPFFKKFSMAMLTH